MNLSNSHIITPWEKIFLTIPRRYKNSWHYFRSAYRRYHGIPGGGYWEYGDIFDILKE